MESKVNEYSGQVLVVDDDEITRSLLQAELEEAGFRVTLASDLGELKNRVRERFFDYALIDLFLGDEDGLEGIPFLVRETPYTKIIMMSAQGTLEVAVDAMERGAASFVSKAKDPRELIDALRSKLASQTPRAVAPEAGEMMPEDIGIIGKSQTIRDVVEKIHQLKDVDSTVLITGESGTGKELVARALHRLSKRSNARFEAVNCGAIPETLLESELFGHKRGAFTDAKADRKGLFELCHGGTLLLDEIGEMPLSLQVKLLRALQEREIMPLGAAQPVKIDVRVVAATNRSLPQEVKKGAFRNDLFYRLAVLQIHLPSLRDRRADISLLMHFFLQRFNQRFNREVAPPSKELESRLLAYDWPGNIRELQNALERGVVLAKDGQLRLEDMMDASFNEEHQRAEGAAGGGTHVPGTDAQIWMSPLSEAKKNFEKAYLQHLLEVTRGNISEIARISGRYRADVYRLMTKYGVEWEEFRN